MRWPYYVLGGLGIALVVQGLFLANLLSLAGGVFLYFASYKLLHDKETGGSR